MHAHHIDHAVDVLAQIARIPSLADGIVAFSAQDLSGGRWYEDDFDLHLGHVWAPVPKQANEVELASACRERIRMAMEANARAREENRRAQDD